MKNYKSNTLFQSFWNNFFYYFLLIFYAFYIHRIKYINVINYINFVDIEGNFITITSSIQLAHHISDESIKRPSSEFKGASVAEDGATVKPAGTTNTATA